MQEKGSLISVAPPLNGCIVTFKPADEYRPDRWVLDLPLMTSQQGQQPVPPGQAPGGPQRLIGPAPTVSNPQQPPQGQNQQQQYQQQYQQQPYRQRQTKALPRTKASLGRVAKRPKPVSTRKGDGHGWLGKLRQAIMV